MREDPGDGFHGPPGFEVAMLNYWKQCPPPRFLSALCKRDMKLDYCMINYWQERIENKIMGGKENNSFRVYCFIKKNI